MFRLFSVKEVAKMQKRIDVLEDALYRAQMHTMIPDFMGDVEPMSSCEEYNEIWKFFNWMKNNHLDILEEYSGVKCGSFKKKD